MWPGDKLQDRISRQGRRRAESLRRQQGSQRRLVRGGAGLGHHDHRSVRLGEDDAAARAQCARRARRGRDPCRRSEDGVEIDFSKPVAKDQLRQYRAQSGFVFQSHNLFPHKTVLQNVTEGPVVVQKRPKDEAEAEAAELLDQVGLAEKKDQYPFQLSGGQQQRVGIARALALKPKVVLFDEPTSALDPELVGEVLSVIKDLAVEGWTLVIVTHEIQFARQVSDQVLFTDRGVILEQGPPSEVIGNPKEERTRQFLDRILNPL